MLTFTTRRRAPGICRRPARQGDAMVLASSSYSYPVLGVFWTMPTRQTRRKWPTTMPRFSCS